MNFRDAVILESASRVGLTPPCDDFLCQCQDRFKGEAWRQMCQCDAPPADTGWMCSECGTDYERLG
jgi:hypothetical protein